MVESTGHFANRGSRLNGLVEVMGRYSNHADPGERLRVLVEMVPSGPLEVELRKAKQVQRRLRTAEVEELVANYQAGRNTIMGHVNRAGVRRHNPALLPEEITEATQLYRSGRSLAAVGGHFGVNASTVRTALLRVGVAMRGCQGRER